MLWLIICLPMCNLISVMSLLSSPCIELDCRDCIADLIVAVSVLL